MAEKLLVKIRNNNLIRGSFVVALGSLGIGLMNYLFHIIVGRIVDVKTFGEVASINSLLQIISFPSGLLIIIATWYSAKDRVSEGPCKAYQKLKVFSFMALKIGLPILMILILFTPSTSQFLKLENHWAINLIWISGLVSIFFGWSYGTLNGLQKFKESSWTGFFGTSVKAVVGIILVKMGLGTLGVSIGLFFGALSPFILALFVIRALAREAIKPDFGKIRIKKQININQYSKFAFIGFFLFNILSNVDMLIAKHNLDEFQAGYYGALSVSAKMIVFLTGAIATVFFSISSGSDPKKNQDKQIFWQSVGLTGGLCFLMLLIYFLFPKFILNLFFGQIYLEGASHLFQFALLASSFTLANLVFLFFLSRERFGDLMTISLIPVAEVAFLFLFGHNISSIVWIAFLSQMAFFLLGLVLILMKTGVNKRK